MRPPATERVAAVAPAAVEGIFFRHAAPNRDAFAGGTGGRWGAAFPVIYLGRPRAAAVAEAYRHLVDDTGVPAQSVKPRVLYTVRVRVAAVLDLTSAENLRRVGLRDADLTTPIDDHVRCQEIGGSAHQLGYHGILAPAAHRLGQTLAIFRDRVTVREILTVAEQTVWDGLPADPRPPGASHSHRKKRP